MTDRKTSPEQPETLNPTVARQGEPRFGARILVISTVLAVLGLIAVYLLVVLMNPAQQPATTNPGPDKIETTQAPPDVPATDNTVEAPSTVEHAPVDPAANKPAP